jgi:signal transduction histidine kinase/DNA-binding response OmpR family regulator
LSNPELNRGKVLVADDNEDISRLVAVNLNFEGYETCLAFNGEEAVEQALKERPDCILLDIMLPRLDGWGVLRALKKQPETRTIPVVLLTGMNLTDRKDKELVEGVAHYVSKPFNPLRLIEIVNDVVASRPQKAPERSTFSAIPSTSSAISEPSKTRVLVIGGGRNATSILQSLLGNEHIEVVGVVEADPLAEVVGLARDLSIPCYRTAAEAGPCDVTIDTEGEGRGDDTIRGAGVKLLLQLLMAREESTRKERTLVGELNERIQELSAMSEMAEVLSGSVPFAELGRRVLELVTRVGHVEAAALLLYDTDTEKFMPRALVNLPAEFELVAQLSLFDPLVGELLSVRRPLTFENLAVSVRSGLVTGAKHTRMQSMVALPMIVKDRVTGILVGYSSRPRPWAATEVQLLSTLAGQAAIAMDNVKLYHAAQEKQALVEQLLSRVIQAQEEERKRVAAEIHDSIAQTLVGMLTLTHTAQTLLDTDPKATAVHLEELRKVIGDSVREIRTIIFNLRPSSLDDLGLVLCLQNYVKRYERESGIGVSVDINGGDRRLPPAMETTVFRLVQESLTNVKKHAAATKVVVRISIEPTEVGVRVADNGRGFLWAEVTEKFQRGDTHGLEGMKERVALMGGKFAISTREGKGTVVDVEIPIQRRDEA